MKGFPAHQVVSPAKQALKCPDFKIKRKSNFWPKLGKALGKATDFMGITDFEDDGTVLSRLYDTIKENRKRSHNDRAADPRSLSGGKKTVIKVPDQGGPGKEEEYLNYADPLMDDPTTFV